MYTLIRVRAPLSDWRIRHIVQDLQKANLAATQQIKYLESENQLLSSEAEQLRQVRSLASHLQFVAQLDFDLGGSYSGGKSGQ